MKRSILVAGVSGAGKSTLPGVLEKMGYKAYDMDGTPALCTMTYKGTSTPVEGHDNADLEKVKNIDWLCDKEKLAALIENESGPITFFCGSASNIDDITPLFDLVILLKVDEKVMRERLSTRADNDFGRTPKVQDWLMEWKDWFEDKMHEKGAIVVDANQDLVSVARDVIAAATKSV